MGTIPVLPWALLLLLQHCLKASAFLSQIRDHCSHRRISPVWSSSIDILDEATSSSTRDRDRDRDRLTIPGARPTREPPLSTDTDTDTWPNIQSPVQNIIDPTLMFGATGRLYSSSTTSSKVVLDRLQHATVVIVGLGGVGSWVAESIVRSGIGRIVMVDLDDICVSNTNRQIHATTETIGQLKLNAMHQRLQLINPNAKIDLVHDFIAADTIPALLDDFVKADNYNNFNNTRITAVVDAIDGAREKAALIDYCRRHQVPIITVGAAAGLMDPTKIVIQDISRTADDKLIAATRRELRAYYNYPPGIPISKRRKVADWNVLAVSSMEPVKQVDETLVSSAFRRCDSALGTACFVTAAFGCVAASSIVRQIATAQPIIPRSFDLHCSNDTTHHFESKLDHPQN